MSLFSIFPSLKCDQNLTMQLLRHQDHLLGEKDRSVFVVVHSGSVVKTAHGVAPGRQFRCAARSGAYSRSVGRRGSAEGEGSMFPQKRSLRVVPDRVLSSASSGSLPTVAATA